MQEKINGFLQFLWTNKYPNWAATITSAICNDQIELAEPIIAGVATKLTRMGTDAAGGLVVGSTVQLLEKYDTTLLPTECTVILSSLRDQNRIIQIGKGRGKGLVIVTAEPVVYGGPDDISPTDRKAVLKALQDVVADDAATIEKLTEELEKKTLYIRTLETEVRTLRQQQSVSDRLSWG